MSVSNSNGKKWALVTGASAGIGKEFCKVLVQNSYNIVLVARRLDKLEELASQLQEQGANTHIIVEDLSEIDAPTRIFENTQENNIVVSCLVNNAGFSYHETFSTSPWEHRANELNVMVNAVTHLCYLYVQKMQEQRFGRIINLSSLAAYLPTSPGNNYNAIKSYVVLFSQALHLEVRKDNVHVCGLCPGLTHSEFHDFMGTSDEAHANFPKIAWMDADEVARQGYAAVMKGKSVFVNGNANRFVKVLMAITPQYIKDLISAYGLFGDVK